MQGSAGWEANSANTAEVRADAGLKPLSPDDVSHAKLLELQSRLIAATLAGTLPWEKWPDGEFAWSSPKGVVDIGPGRLSIWDDRGTLLRRFRPDSDDLYRAAARWHEEMACAALDRILANLDAVESANRKANRAG